jgi:hypothetical protein
LTEQSEPLRKAREAAGARQAEELAARARELAQKERELAETAQETRRQPLADQQRLQGQTSDLEKELKQLSEKMGHSPQAQSSLQHAAQLSRQAQAAMQQSQDRDRQRKPSEAKQARLRSALNLDQAARQADAAAQQMAASQSATPGQPASESMGRALQRAEAAMQQAEVKLAQNLHQAAQGAMQRAAQGLRQANRQMTQRAGRPSPTAMQPNTGQVTEGGAIEPGILGGEAKKYAGKRWGELPGELRTRIIQDMQAKYGDDYARIIKLYFEQVAETRK